MYVQLCKTKKFATMFITKSFSKQRNKLNDK